MSLKSSVSGLRTIEALSCKVRLSKAYTARSIMSFFRHKIWDSVHRVVILQT